MSLTFTRFGRVEEYADNKKTLIDFDEGLAKLREFDMRLPHVCRVIHNKPIWIRYDKTRHGWHIIILWRKTMLPWSILALQAILGSDWRREAMNWARLASGRTDAFAMKRWNILYSKKLY